MGNLGISPATRPRRAKRIDVDADALPRLAPMRLGNWINRLNCWWSGLGLPPKFQAALEVRGRTSGRHSYQPNGKRRGWQ